MCGLAGIVKLEPGRRPERARLERMGKTLVHRGPDDDGIALFERAGLVHRRLSIIDLEGGHQPMANEHGDVWIAYNGELYNYRELRETLRSHGCRFFTESDTEVILRAYETFGEDCVKHLRGMFAFAVWDERRTRLFLARDPLGIKPLYYAVSGGELLFGSEIKALLAGGLVPKLDKAALPEYLASRYVAGAGTFFKGIYRLEPGHTLTWTHAGACRRTRYWQLPERLDDTVMSMQECAGELRMRLEDAVRSHLVSDVPVGLFLSGGIDSSTLACMMGAMRDEPVLSFGVGFAEQGYNELSWARLAAEAAGTEHRDVVMSGEDFFAALPQMVWHEDEPIAFPSSVSLYFVSRLAAKHVKVVLTGEGADELFLGYNRYRVTAWNQRLGRPYWTAVPGGVRAGVNRALDGLPRTLRRYAQRSFLGSEPGVRGLFYENFALFGDDAREELLGGAAGFEDPYERALECYARAPGGALERMCHADLQTYLVELLMKQDQMSMAASLESRVPFLDTPLVEFAAALPGRYKLHGWQTKAVLREAVKDILPREILTRGKMGFPVPLANWFRGSFAPLLDDLVLGERALDRGLFDANRLRRLVAEHKRGAWNHADRLWALMNLELWQRIFLDEEGPGDALHEELPRAGMREVA
ncbi:MAG: asparagine synthase (glutamine-hydrolyzing) [Gammaproteobacteria bacterium]|nr:asparagine synthase (glutamine-hydrolyzing) [Gammaproteobacteria bacterium]